jgi:hypothetical protein
MKNLFSKIKNRGMEIYTITLIVIAAFWLSHFLINYAFK